MTRKVLYMAHPVAPTADDIAAVKALHGQSLLETTSLMPANLPAKLAIVDNIQGAPRWLSWLSASFPEVTFIAPWIAGVLAVHGDGTPEQREAGLVDDCAVIERCNGIVLVGGRISNGMQREMEHGIRRHDDREVFWYSAKFEVYDLTRWSTAAPPNPALGNHGFETFMRVVKAVYG